MKRAAKRAAIRVPDTKKRRVQIVTNSVQPKPVHTVQEEAPEEEEENLQENEEEQVNEEEEQQKDDAEEVVEVNEEELQEQPTEETSTSATVPPTVVHIPQQGELLPTTRAILLWL